VRRSSRLHASKLHAWPSPFLPIEPPLLLGRLTKQLDCCFCSVALLQANQPPLQPCRPFLRRCPAAARCRGLHRCHPPGQGREGRPRRLRRRQPSCRRGPLTKGLHPASSCGPSSGTACQMLEWQAHSGHPTPLTTRCSTAQQWSRCLVPPFGAQAAAVVAKGTAAAVSWPDCSSTIGSSSVCRLHDG
jgi:hypothetical protein